MLNASLVDRLTKDNEKLKQDYTIIQQTLTLLKDENKTLTDSVNKLKEKVDYLQTALNESHQELNTYSERQTTILSELNNLKETIMDNNSLLSRQNNDENNVTTSNLLSVVAARSIPAPSKVMVDDQKKKDNRLVELRRMTREYMKVSDEEAGLRLYKLQKTMIHVVSDLKKYMKERNEDISKSWKSIDINTQRVAFEMVEREASSLGVPLHMCIGYWGARRLISKSWANALRTTKKHIKLEDSEESSNKSVTAKELHPSNERQVKRLKLN
ncbi:uncharacterized protein BX663DRAFT_487839 [Cokeromyces recurvatus]|uniref:uncharacterized protein n=1 Tax=Cokeromyces recurvatus TaxID=90255 RepID=UPI00221EC087|nr:uncharacterized protein BX663DRAFT_487839 [Cokeromyces recurvatus]KAI7901267.1 hypothetical protein BX663DRAFT_487839 [Cokeromyces recurvatus]